MLLELLRAAPITIVGIITAYIAWQQWQTSRQRLQFDLYDRRLRVYEAVQGLIARASELRQEDVVEFRRATSEADFLFGEIPNPISSYLEELVERARDHAGAERQYRRRSEEQDPTCNTMLSHLLGEIAWGDAQRTAAREAFSPYLSMAGAARGRASLWRLRVQPSKRLRAWKSRLSERWRQFVDGIRERLDELRGEDKGGLRP